MPSEDGKQNLQCPQPAGAVDPEEEEPFPAPKPERKQVPRLASGPQGSPECHLSSEQDVLGTTLGLASPGLMKAQDCTSGQNTQAFPWPCSGQRLARATPYSSVRPPLAKIQCKSQAVMKGKKSQTPMALEDGVPQDAGMREGKVTFVLRWDSEKNSPF